MRELNWARVDAKFRRECCFLRRSRGEALWRRHLADSLCARSWYKPAGGEPGATKLAFDQETLSTCTIQKNHQPIVFLYCSGLLPSFGLLLRPPGVSRLVTNMHFKNFSAAVFGIDAYLMEAWRF
jgi:hypothetical protein